MDELLLIGHSHISCFEKVAKNIRNVTVINLRKIRESLNTEEEAIKALREIAGGTKPKAVCLSLRGNDHNILTLLEHPKPFAIANQVDLLNNCSERWPIPYSAMKDSLEKTIREKIEHLSITIFKAFPKSRRFYIPPPPPISDWGHIKNNPGIFKDKIDLGFPPLALKMAVYKMQIDILEDLYSSLETSLITIDDSAKTEKGFLKPSYFNNDPTHANALYGELMMNKILKETGIKR
ncbi:hypothetical protein DIT71_16965 [Marinobacter vulgaris]|uniref:SGNH/GDSL hydrolase family protein n=1 Tax=Marinobacter vulgaris TaxID=1928331 RepID=A0A2V3ZG88_9GAMM|nr:hypothetical protein [Marinobacter vulgaris]PXX88879.1 hypothetical protein DIT71_16965 [Marinobacter vulgaris]TSJ66690.1 hypothetical protein FPC41_17120 [Marinobacter vulgaris]